MFCMNKKMKLNLFSNFHYLCNVLRHLEVVFIKKECKVLKIVI